MADTGACFSDFTYNFDRITNSSPIGCNRYHFKEDLRVVDAVGETYKNIDFLNRNFMIGQSFSFSTEDTDRFTVGQADRMKETIVASTISGNLLRQKLSRNADGTANVSVLFLPYASTDIGGNIIRTIDNGDGTANVCRARLREHKFQPGFDYMFSGNYDTDPIIVSKNDFPVPAVKLHTEDYPITIAQLGAAPENSGSVSVVCTKGMICGNEIIRRGTLFSTQVLGSMNITVEELDAIEVKDPDLYNNLMGQYYYILKKETDSGAKLQEIFFKQ